jgi:hypothetical protein
LMKSNGAKPGWPWSRFRKQQKTPHELEEKSQTSSSKGAPVPSGLGFFSRVFLHVSEAPSKKLWFQPAKRRDQGLAGYLQETDVRTDMSAPLDANGMETGAVLSRHFTRAGRDPLVLAPFEERMIEGRSVRVPASWAPGALSKLSRAIGDGSSSDFLTQRAKSLAESAGETDLLHEHEPEVLADELAWILARGMGWVAEESGMWVGVLNLHHFCEPVTQRFDLAGLRQAGRCLMIAAAGQAKKAGSHGSFSLGWTNGAGFLLVAGIPYDSSRAVGILGCVSAMILGEAALTSARLAERNPSFAQEADKEVVLSGLSHAKAKVAELPPTGQVTPPAADSGRWASQTQEVLNEAVAAVNAFGVLGAYPTAPQAVAEAEAWLDPISRLAEAIPTLQVTDLAARPEIRSSLKAMGLAESQRGAVLSAIAGGGSILEAGVPESKAPSLKTALGSWSFHPNAQVMMGAAVAPFVAGVLQHRIILPDGIPEEFRAMVMSAAQRFGLSGALPYVHGAKAAVEATAAPTAPAQETPAPEAVTEELIAAEPVQEEASVSETETPEEVTSQATEAIVEEVVVEESVADEPQVEETIASDPDPVEDVEEVEAEQIADSSLIPPPLPTESVPVEAQASEEVAPEQIEAEVETESEPDQEVEAPKEEESVSEESNYSEQAVLDPEPEPESEPEPDQQPEVASEEEEASHQEAENDLNAAPLVGAVLAGGAVAAAVSANQEETPETETPAEAAEETVEPESELEPAAEAEAAPDTDEPQEPLVEEAALTETTPENLGQETIFDSGCEAPAPSAHFEPTFWSKSVNLKSQGVDIVLHAFRRTEGGPLEAAVTTHQLTAMNKILLDSLLTSVNLGLSQGVSIKDYARSITQPGLVRDILKALSDLSEN